MARVTHVKSARKAQGHCVKCGREIKQGDSYKWLANRIGRSSIKKKFCEFCQIRQSDRTTSGNLQTLYGAVEAAEDQLAEEGLTLSDIAQALRDAAEGARETASMYEESAQNIEDGFGHSTYQSEEIQEKAQECEGFADELDSAADEVESMPDPDAGSEDFADELDPDEDDREAAIEDLRIERRDEAVSMAQDALGNCPL
jgi:hypothetical protein